MDMATIDGKEYDLDTVLPEARTQLEQLRFLASDVAKMMVPAADLLGKLEASRQALAQALASA